MEKTNQIVVYYFDDGSFISYTSQTVTDIVYVREADTVIGRWSEKYVEHTRGCEWAVPIDEQDVYAKLHTSAGSKEHTKQETEQWN